MASRSLSDRIAAFFAEMVTDIREKVVEEPWFGRAVTESAEPSAPGVVDMHEARSPSAVMEPESWEAYRTRLAYEHGPAVHQEQARDHEPDHDYDR